MKTSLSILIAAALVLSGCQRASDDMSADTHAGHDHFAPAASDTRKATLYQCSMHPNIVSDKPGKCPICGMDLQPVQELDVKGIPGRSAVELSREQRQLINIRTLPVVEREVLLRTRAVGMVMYDETRVANISSRVSGWVEALEVNSTGQFVEKGQPLMTLYSPQLFSASQDLLLALRHAEAATGEQRRKSSAALAESARKRLVLFGLTDSQVDALAERGEAASTLDVEAPRSGTVVEKMVVEGQEISPQMPLYRIADLSEVWMEVEIYEYELNTVEEGQSVEVSFTSYPGRVFTGAVDFIYPFLETRTRTAKVRIALPNEDGLLKPGMYGSADLRTDLGESRVVPASAIFDTGRRQYVFVERDEGLFVPAIVKLGARSDDVYVVRSGLEVGDEVVVNGNFLLDSESQLKATAAGDLGESEEPDLPASTVPAGTYATFLKAYFSLSDALAADDSERAAGVLPALKDSVNALRESGGRPDGDAEQYEKYLKALSKTTGVISTENLEKARIGFGEMSRAAIDLLVDFPARGEHSLYIMTCPMWTLSPARWVQKAPEVVNPLMGKAMLGCGTMTKELQ